MIAPAPRHHLFRASARLLVAAVTALSLMSAVPAQAASTPAVSRLSATATPLTVLRHNTVTIAGTVTPRGTGVVRLERYLAGKWVQLAHKSTSKTGSYSFAFKTSGTLGTTIYRVTRSASSTARAAVSKTMHVHVVKSAYKVKAAAHSAVASATPIVVTGSVSPKVKGTVRLEVLQHGAWHAIASAALSASSTYSLSKVEPTGAYAVRVRSPLTTTIASGVSPTVKVTVAAPAAPTASVKLSGTPAGVGLFSSPVTVTASAAAAAGVKATTYVLDGAAAKPYTAPVSVTAAGAHSFKVTVTDALGRTASATATWTIQGSATDTTKPTATFKLTGNAASPDVYSGNVGVTINAADASGIKSISYVLDGGGSQTYTAPFTVTTPGAHSVLAVVTDNANNQTTISATWTQQASTGSPQLVVSSSDQATLGLAKARLVFSSYRGNAAAVPAKLVTLTNTGTDVLQVSGIGVTGGDAGSYRLSPGQPTSLTIAPGASATVSVEFRPTDPTGCADTASPVAISPDVDRNALLSFSTNDAAQPGGSADLSGLVACGQGGNGEPVLDQVLTGLGYSDTVYNSNIDRRFIGPNRYLAGTDEVQSPYFTAADNAAPVSLVPIAHYGTGNTASSGYQSTGWYAQGAAMTPTTSLCNSSCKQLWKFPADPSTTTYDQNQKLLPTPVGVTTFTPTGSFGLYSGDFTDVNFSDDALNVGNQNYATGHTADAPLPVPHYLHDMRIFPAYGPGHALIPNTYIVTIDLSRVPAYKNNDFQDIVLLLSNATPANGQGRVLNGTADTVDFTAGGSVSPTCDVTGFDGVMANTGGTQCNAGNIAIGANGLTLTSTAGQLANHDQQNALYQSFDATRGAFTITTRIVGPINQLTSDYQQI
ncbi:MAG: hypothetical protein QOJ83_2620, partial [Frankiales bacterium]|nr:hypothetical protein [Frankiales bacterium]